MFNKRDIQNKEVLGAFYLCDLGRKNYSTKGKLGHRKY